MAEFVTPDFLKNCSTNDIHKKMAEEMPADIDLSAGNHAWNMTRPTAIAVAEMCQYYLVRTLELILPEHSYGTFLVGHAKSRNLTPRAATPASGEVLVTGKAGTPIPAGTLFSTASVNDEPSVEYESTASATIPSSGSVTLPIQCTQTGIIGNTGANTIIMLASKNTGITSVTNPEAVTGGTEKESDESLRKRIDEVDKSQGESYAGTIADYKRWAKSVDGVGEATVIPAQDDSGLVQIILTDANGDPATTNLCDAVYNYIMSPDEPNQRRAPIGASLAVNPPATMRVAVKATVELKNGATISAVKSAYAALLVDYLPEAFADGEIKYSRVWAALASTPGVNDFTGLKIGVNDGGTVTYGTTNIEISESQLPIISEDTLNLTAGTV